MAITWIGAGASKLDPLQQHATHQEPVDEEHVQRAHQEAYQGGGASNMSASSLGGAAAMQVSTSGFTCLLVIYLFGCLSGAIAYHWGPIFDT